MDFNIRKNSIKIFVLCWIFLVIGSLVAGTQQEAFLQAHRYYQEGNVAKALELYQAMPSKGMAIMYNIGNCYYAQKNFPMAVLHWLRAQKDASIGEYKILKFYIRQAYIDSGVHPDITIWESSYNFFIFLTGHVSLLIWQILFLICWILLLVKGISWLQERKYGLLAIVIILFACFSCINFAHYRNQKYPKGIVTKNSISVYAGPGMDYAVLGTAKVFDCMRVYKSNEGWYLIYTSSFGYGWVSEKDFAII